MDDFLESLHNMCKIGFYSWSNLMTFNFWPWKTFVRQNYCTKNLFSYIHIVLQTPEENTIENIVGTLLIAIVISHKFSLSILHLALHVTWLFLETLNMLLGLLPFVICLLFDSCNINRYIAQNLHCCRTKRDEINGL